MKYNIEKLLIELLIKGNKGTNAQIFISEVHQSYIQGNWIFYLIDRSPEEIRAIWIDADAFYKILEEFKQDGRSFIDINISINEEKLGIYLNSGPRETGEKPQYPLYKSAFLPSVDRKNYEQS